MSNGSDFAKASAVFGKAAETSDPDERMRALCQGLSLLAKGFDSMDASMASPPTVSTCSRISSERSSCISALSRSAAD